MLLTNDTKAGIAFCGRETPTQPIVFLHIPKTAGTSLITMLRNTFGDSRLLRINDPGAPTPAQIDHQLAALPAELACLIGHIPFYWFARHLHRFRFFTLLRDPVDRTMSLYRFLRKASAPELELLGLQPGFTFDDFIETKSAGMYRQINNGMCRMLCRDPRMSDPNHSAFWNTSDPTEMLKQAFETLQSIDFGLVEQMGLTLRLLIHAWNIPHQSNEYHENATNYDDFTGDIESVHRIIKCNTLDLVLYHRATALFRARLADMPTDASTATHPAAVFRPILDQEIPIGDVPGRQGFHEREPTNIAWLMDKQPARLHFTAPSHRLRLRLNFYAIVPNYPITETSIILNEQRLYLQSMPSENPGWFRLESDPIQVATDQNLLTIMPPWFLPVRYLDATSKDRRSLALALSSLAFLSVD